MPRSPLACATATRRRIGDRDKTLEGAWVLRGILNRRSGFAQTLAAFVLLAMVVRGFIPTGYMLAPAESGRFVTVILCAAHGGRTAVLDRTTGDILDPTEAGKKQEPARPHHSEAPCMFAAMATLAAPETPAALTALLGITYVEYAPKQVMPGRGLAAPPPWSTGPPTQA